MSKRPQPDQRLAARRVLPDGMELVLRVIPMPADSNANGTSSAAGSWRRSTWPSRGCGAHCQGPHSPPWRSTQFRLQQPVSGGRPAVVLRRVLRVGTTSVTGACRGLCRAQPGGAADREGHRRQPDLRAIDHDGAPRPILKETKEG